MSGREWQIGVCGTFDVENYGDLLFPLLAEAELSQRLGPVKLHAFSYHAKSPPDWPYEVTSVAELPRLIQNLDGLLIGGGFIIRFDKFVAPGYGPPSPAIHHPTGYWLTPALMALQHGIPLIWNAPGMHCNEIPAWAEPLIELALTHSRYVAVRDKPSQAALSRFADTSRIAVLPDTAFGISRLLARKSVELSRLREHTGLTDPYIVVQPIGGLEPTLRFIRTHAHMLRGYRFLVLPIGPVLGDHEANLGGDLPGLVRLANWPQPLLLAELISQAAAVIGRSYHLAITALACGVPVFCAADLAVGKYTSLSDFETIYPLPNETETDPRLFITRLGKTSPSPTARDAFDTITAHWDRIATILREGATQTQPPLNRFWQMLPNLLEASSNRLALEIATRDDQIAACNSRITARDEQIAACEVRIAARDEKIAARDEQIAACERRIAAINNSRSWKVTAPLRFLRRN